MDEFLTQKEVAGILKVSTMTVQRLRKNDETFPKPVYLGGGPRWLLSDLISWAKKYRGNKPKRIYTRS